jgi:hypothetical protein
MDLTAKLQIKPGQTVAAIGMPDGVPPLADDANPADEPGAADAVVAFVRNRAELDTGAADAAVAAARLDRLAWVAYPKAGKLGTDLNRDILAGLLAGRGVRPVRQVAIDETWSALRFRPALPGHRGLARRPRCSRQKSSGTSKQQLPIALRSCSPRCFWRGKRYTNPIKARFQVRSAAVGCPVSRDS